MSEENHGFTGWMILELMGHRRLFGLVSEQEIAGASFLRVDVYRGQEEKACATQFYSASAVYCMTPTTEDLARQMAAQAVPQPVSRFELPPAPTDDSERSEAEASAIDLDF